MNRSTLIALGVGVCIAASIWTIGRAGHCTFAWTPGCQNEDAAIPLVAAQPVDGAGDLHAVAAHTQASVAIPTGATPMQRHPIAAPDPYPARLIGPDIDPLAPGPVAASEPREIGAYLDPDRY